MADPTSTLNTKYLVDKQRQVRVIKNAEALVVGAYLAHNFSLGKTEFADDAASLSPLGICIGEKNGLNQNLTGDSGGNYSAVARGGVVVEKVTVTGASAITDVGKFVYCTDGQTLTLTKPSVGVAFGIVTYWHTSTTCDVYLFDFVEGVLLSLVPPAKRLISLGQICSYALEGTSAIDLISYTSTEHFLIDSVHARCIKPDAGLVAGAQTVNLEIGTTNLTGGVVTLGYANCDATADLYVAIDGTAVTAANEVHQGDVITAELAASGTGFTAAKQGIFELYVMATMLPGA